MLITGNTGRLYGIKLTMHAYLHKHQCVKGCYRVHALNTSIQSMPHSALFIVPTDETVGPNEIYIATVIPIVV